MKIREAGRRIPVFVMIAGFLLAPLAAQNEHPGLPIITNYPPEEYNADIQNWAAVQDKRGLLYVANTSGVLEFDGRDWRLIPVGGNLAARSLAAVDSGRIYVGALGDFGYLEADERGDLVFRSLGIAGGLKTQEIGDVVTAVVIGETVVFQSADGIFLYQDNRLSIIRPETRFSAGFAVRDAFYLRQGARGLYRLVGDRLEFVPGSERFAEDRIFAMLPNDRDVLLLGSRDGGFFFFRPGAGAKVAFVKAAAFSDMERILRGQKVGVCARLSDGRLAFSTTQSGLYICSSAGVLLDHLDKSKGLLNDGIYYLYKDPRDNLVLCLSVGISYVETGTPIRLLTDKSGLNGAGSAALYRPPSAGPGSGPRLYLGTYQGLFVRDERPFDVPFIRIPGSMETMSLIERNGHILVAHNEGIAEIKNGRLKQLQSNRIGIGFLSPSPRPDLLLAGTFNGLIRLKYTGGEWKSLGPVAGFTQGCFNLAEAPDGRIWLYTNAGNGIFCLTLSENFDRVVAVKNLTRADGLPADAGNLVFPGSDGIRIATVRGLYRYNADRDRCEPDPDFPETARLGRPIRLVHEAPNGDLWVGGDGFCGVYRRGSDGRSRLENGLLNRLPFFRIGDFMTTLPTGNLLVGFKDGFIQIDPNRISIPAESRSVTIRRVESRGRLLFAGSKVTGRNPKDAGGRIPELSYRKNQIRFTYAAPFLESAGHTEYRTRLEGYETDWSSWSRQAVSSFTNLGEGTYTLHVEARNVYGQVGQGDAWSFVVLPPWYRTWPAYLVFGLSGFLALVGLMKGYNRKLLREKVRLQRLVDQKTRELKDAALTDPLTGLRNRRYLSDILQSDIDAFVSQQKFILQNKNRRNRKPGERLGFGVLMIDIDHFKEINDRFGHAAGDRLLRQFAGILRASVREDDVVLRFGGEEFLVVLKKTVLDYPEICAEKVRAAVENAEFDLGEGAAVRRTCSVGYTNFPFYPEAPDRASFDQALRIADLGLYQAKKGGRNRTVGISPLSPNASVEETDVLFADLDTAVEKGLLRVRPGRKPEQPPDARKAGP